jgi:predicted ATP-binding protein involved in virulence
MPYTSITDLHEDVFLHLLQKQKTKPNLYFTLRGAEDRKLKEGYWFDNFKESITFSFWDGYDQISHAARISISVTIEGQLHIYLNARDSEYYANIFSIISKQMGFSQYNIKKGSPEKQWQKRYNDTDWKVSLDKFIEDEIPKMGVYLELSQVGQTENIIKRIDKLVYETKYYNRIVAARKSFFANRERATREEELRLQNEREAQERERIRIETERKRVKVLKLKNISLKNIGHFNDISLDLSSRITVLIGENGSGKSTILRAITLGITGVEIFRPDDIEPTKWYLQDENITKWLKIVGTTGIEPSYSKEGEISLSYTIDEESFENKIVWQKEDKKKYAEVNNVFSGEEDSFKTLQEKKVADDKTETHLVNLVIVLPQGGGYRPATNHLKEEFYPDPYELLPMITHSATDKLRNLENWIELYDFRYKETEPREEKWLRAIKHLFEIISKITVEKEQQIQENGYQTQQVEFLRIVKDEKNKSRIVIKKGDSPDGIYFDMLSDGYNNLFYWVGTILSNLYRFSDYVQGKSDYEGYWSLPITEIPAMVIIDEIDTYLHPKWQRSILKVLVAEFPKLRFVVTTHSLAVISSLKKEKDGYQIYRAKKLNNQSNFEEITPQFGFSLNQTAADIMKDIDRDSEVFTLENSIENLIASNQFENAKQELERLNQQSVDYRRLKTKLETKKIIFDAQNRKI